MEYYNSQCLLYNLVRENNLLKSQINNLNNIIANNKNSTSENTSSGLSKDEVTQLIQNTDSKEHEHTSSQISDRISEYVTESKYTCDITPNEGIFAFYDQPITTGEYDGRCYIEFNHTITLTLNYKEQTFELTSDTVSNTSHHIEDIILNKGIDDFFKSHIFTPKNYDEKVIIKLTNIKDGETKYSDTTITFNPKNPLTDMNSDYVMTANAVNQYTSNQYQKLNGLLDKTYPLNSIFLTRENLTSEKIAQKLGGGLWGVLPTNIVDSTGYETIYAWIRTK